MTAQEQQLIDELVNRIRTTQVQNKDDEADQRLQQGLANVPDALYVLAQTVIVQKYGLEQAQARLQALQSELEAARQQNAAPQKPAGGSFLSHIFGGGQSEAQTSTGSAAQPAWQPVSSPGYPQAPPVYPAGSYGQGGYGQGSFGAAPSGGGGFMQSALQTAAGVAMGEMAFQGVESLFHGFGGGSGEHRGFNDTRSGETVVNNYYGDDERASSDRNSREDSNFYNPTNDASRSDGGRGFAGTDDDRSTADDLRDQDNDDTSSDFIDDGSNDDSSYDDSGSTDDSSSF